MSRRYRIFVPHASDRFTNHLPNGDGLVAFEVASRLAERGHTVHVMARTIDVRGTLPATLHLHPLGRAVPRGSAGFFGYVRQLRATYAKLARERPFDLIHQLNPVHAGISLMLADARVPVVLGAYVAPWPRTADSAVILGATQLPFAPALRRCILALQQRFASAIILSTPAAEGQIPELRRSRRKISIVPHGIDPSRYGGRESDASEDAPLVLFLGGTERRKGIYVLLEAFIAVRKAIPSARLLIAGAGGREGEVARAVAAMDERDSIEMLGVVERNDVPALMRRITVFAAPSFGEPFGMALLEAMASGKPVVVTDSGGPAHIVDPAGGVKVAAGDARALGDALIRVLQSPELIAAMGRHNRERVESEYAWDHVIDRIEAVYARVLDARRTA